MKQETKRFLSVLAAVFLLTAALVLYANFIRREYRLSQEIKEDLLSRQEFLDTQKVAIDKIIILINTVKGEKATLQQEAISLALPPREDVGGAVLQLTGLVRINGLELKSLNVASSPSLRARSASLRGVTQKGITKVLGRTLFDLRMFGSYGDFKNFLNDLESNARVFEVQGLDIDPAGRSDQNLYNFNLTIVAYYQST